MNSIHITIDATTSANDANGDANSASDANGANNANMPLHQLIPKVMS